MPTTVITRKGQVTIPAAYRQALGLSKGDRMEVALDGNAVRLVRAERVAARTAGMLAGSGPILSAKALRAAAEQAIAGEVEERSRRRPHAVQKGRRR
jgi:AbrB family looped-hinge helix DNA binding protein